MATKSLPKQQAESKPTVDINGLTITFHHAGRVWTTTATKLGYALVEVGGPTSQKAHERMRALLSRVCEQAFAASGPEGFAAIYGEPTLPPLTLADVTITDEAAGKAYSGQDVAALVRLASARGSATAVWMDDANLQLRGLSVLCEKAAKDQDSYRDDELVLWFVSGVLRDVAARVEAGTDHYPNANRFTVAWTAPEAK